MKIPDLLATLATSFWPVIPLFWLPVHLLPWVRKTLGLLFYPLIVAFWIFLTYVVFTHRLFAALGLLSFPYLIKFSGALLIFGGLYLKLLTIFYLKHRILGLPHFRPSPQDTLVTEGPFRLCRHPSYLSHTLFFLGTFLLTGYLVVGVIALLDFLITRFLIIPLEEKELLVRFGPAYEKYRRQTPTFFPRFRP